MGDRSWTNDSYASLSARRVADKGVAAFSYTSDIKAGKVAPKVSPRLDMTSDKVVKIDGKGVRESRDNAEHPESNAVVVLFDVTGSMLDVPRTVQQKLPKLMTNLITKGYLSDPQILFGAIGDADYDKAPLQIGQFESDVAMDEDIDQIYLEGGGGGNNEESYDLALYFVARHTIIDCWEKRGKKGYLFLMGDESLRDVVPKRHINAFLDGGAQDDVSIAQIIKELEEKYEIFFINPQQTSHKDRLMTKWKKLLGQRVLPLEDANLVCELIVTTIGVNEGIIDSAGEIASDLGLDKGGASIVDRALTEYKKSGRRNELATASVSGGNIARKGKKNTIENL